MKKTINQLANWHFVPLKLVGTLLLITIFSSVFGQVNDPPGFDVEKERQKAIVDGVPDDELEGYLTVKRRYALVEYEYKILGKGSKNFKPTLSFSRKSWNSSPACEGTFENNDVAPWSAQYGTNNYGISSFVNNTAIFYPGVAYSRHTIMTTGNYDTKVTTIPVVRPGGGQHSLRLGNSGTGAEAERVSKTVTVSGSCLSFWYALVLEDPAHDYNDQSFFMFRLFDSANNVLDSFVKEASNDPFFSRQGSYAYRDWTKYTVELGCDYRGKTVTIEFTTSDCRLTGDFGYAYIDDVCFENCVSCCNSCSDLLRFPSYMSSYPVITKSHSTDSTCCFKFNFIFDPDIFGCDPYGVKVYKDGDTSVVYSSYSNDSGLVYEKPLYNPSALDFCLNKSSFTSTTTVRVAFYDKNGNKICDTIKQVLKPCCDNCEDLINLPELYTTYPIIQFRGSTDSSCCYKFSLPIFVAQVFKCSPYGVKIYETANPSIVYSSYQGVALDKGGFNLSSMDFCVGRSGFTSPKTLTIAFYDSLGNLICDSITRVIEPCHSTSSGCNCTSLFENSNFADASIVKKDTAASDEYDCCFTIEPFRDSSIIKCPYYGMRVYKDTVGGIGYAYLDSFKTGTPIGGPGADMGDTNKMKFCIGAYVFSNNGPQKLRIEYLDSTGKVICSKTETVNCEQSCCENVNVFVRKDTTETDPFKCCYRIEVWAFACNKTFTAELMRETDSGWVNAGNDTFSISRPIFFDVCADNSDTARYMVFIKDSSGKVLCNKEVIQTCPNCCDIVAYTATYVPPPPHSVIDRCCWDINVYPAASEDCNIGYWGVYDSLHKVPSSYSPIFSPPSTIYQGRHCTPIIQAPNPAPGTSITIKYCIKRYLAVYDVTGKLLCIKPFELCCYRTYTNYNGNPQGPMSIGVVPNPFNEAFTMSMDLPQPMPVAVNVVNSSGTVVFERNYGQQPAGEFTTEINLAGLPPGNYTLSVNNGQATAQIVKQ